MYNRLIAKWIRRYGEVYGEWHGGGGGSPYSCQFNPGDEIFLVQVGKSSLGILLKRTASCEENRKSIVDTVKKGFQFSRPQLGKSITFFKVEAFFVQPVLKGQQLEMKLRHKYI